MSKTLKVSFVSTGSNKTIKHEMPDSSSPGTEDPSLSSGSNTYGTMASIPSYLLAEKLVPVLVDLFLRAPALEKCTIFPEIVQGLAR